VSKRETKDTLIDMRSRAMMRWPALSYAALPFIIMAFIMIASLIGYGLTSANLEMARQRSIERRFHESERRINTQFNSYAHLLWGSTGFMQSGPISENDWEKFIGTYDLAKNFKGIEAVGIAYGSTPQSTSISYVSPLTTLTQSTVGVNAGLSPAIAPAMAKAAETNQTIISDTIPNIFSTKTDTQSLTNGLLMFSPFYDESLPRDTTDQRAAALRGYAIAMFRGDVLFKDMFASVDLAHTKLQIYLGDAKKANLQYQVDNTTNLDQTVVTQQVQEYGKTFTVVYTFDTAEIVEFTINYLPLFILFGGMIIGIIVSLIAGYLLRSRYRRLIYQKEQDVNFAKDELLSLASHQLRTPATGVKQYLGMVLQGFAGDLKEQQRTYLERAYSSNNRQLHIINDILHLAKLEAGRIVLAEHKFDIADMIREVVEEQKSDAEKGGISLDLQAPPIGMMVGDSHMLRMVVENLISNGIKYTEPEGAVSVRLIKRGLHWTLIVKDTGVGIANKDLNKLFKQFSRIANSRSDYVTGTGIGLYLTHHLVLLHGGTVSVSSEEGKGSTFTVRLPRKM
jgi:signal transduction histidine kinase